MRYIGLSKDVKCASNVCISSDVCILDTLHLYAYVGMAVDYIAMPASVCLSTCRSTALAIPLTTSNLCSLSDELARGRHAFGYLRIHTDGITRACVY